MPRAAGDEREDEHRAAEGCGTARWVSGYHSAEEQFFAEELDRLAELERGRECPRPRRPTPAD